MMQSSKKIQIERVFLSTEMPFITAPAQPASASRFPKVLALYAPTHSVTAGGTAVFEWTVSDALELKKVAKMYYVRYNLAAR